MSTSAARPGLLRRLWALLSAYHWFIVLFFAILAFALGWFGIREYYCAMSGAVPCAGITTWDVGYLTLQLFIWQSGNMFLGSSVPCPLQLARLLAPGVVAWVAVQGLIALFVDEWHFFRARFSRQHVLICGLGRLGETLAAGFHAAGWRVVAIEADEDRRSVTTVRAYASVIVGDARDATVLDNAGVRSATHLIVVCGDDGVNADVAARAGEIMAGEDTRMLTCHVHIADPTLWAQLRVRDAASRSVRGLRLHLFSVVDAAAGALAPAALSAIVTQNAGTAPHLLVAGVGAVGEHVVARAGRSWLASPGRPGERLRITLVDAHAAAAAARLAARYPRLTDVCTLVPIDIDVRSPAFERGEVLASIGPVGAACVTAGDDAVAMAAGMALVHASSLERYPVFVCTTHEQGLGLLLADAAGAEDLGRLRLFGTFERGCSPALLLHGTNEVLARAIHEEYIRNQASRGNTPATNPAMRSWEQLSDVLRESNRRQADHIGAKLDAVDCGIGPMLDWNAPAVTFTRDEVERMARLEHARWVEERLADGWRFDPGAKNEERKTSPYLVEWEVLADAVRDFDRNTVRELPAFLARAGFTVYRKGTAAVPAASGREG